MSFSPYFSDRPASEYTSEHALEARSLEAKPDLNPFEKRRLLDIYTAEQRSLRSSTSRYGILQERIQKLKAEVAELDSQTQKMAQDTPPEKVPEKAPNIMKNSPLKKEYAEVMQLWNRDEQGAALAKIDDLEKTSFGQLNAAEKVRFYNVRFRVALELKDMALAGRAYESMHNADSCDPETTQAAFLLSLISFTNGDSQTAKRIFIEQCDSDKSTSNLTRRKYWLARFGETLGEPTSKLYQEVAQSSMPGYHTFLAQVRLNQKVTIPQTGVLAVGQAGAPKEPAKAAEFPVPRAVNDSLAAAEERLKANLRRDASTMLTKASRILRDKADEDYLPAMLYTAHLFHAAGNHLEAMKLYTDVSNAFMEGNLLPTFITPNLFSEMYPRPYSTKVEWLSRMWQVDPDFVYSIVRQESAFNPTAVSASDARGLMQLMPFLAKSLARQWNFNDYFNEKQLFNAEENLKLGIFHINQLQRVAPHPALMAAAYNAGISRVANWWKRYGQFPLDVFVEFIPITETRYYVKYVIRNMYFYKALRNGGAADANSIPFSLSPPTQELISSLR